MGSAAEKLSPSRVAWSRRCQRVRLRKAECYEWRPQEETFETLKCPMDHRDSFDENLQIWLATSGVVCPVICKRGGVIY